MSIFTVFPKRGFVDPANSQFASPNFAVLANGSYPQLDSVTLAFDALVSEAPQYMGQLTESVIENGAVINDHFTARPLRLTVEGVISDTPLSTSPFATAAQAAGALGAANSQSPGSYQKFSARAFAYLENLYLQKSLFDFVGGFRIYANMMITEWRPTRTAETSGSLEFTMTMEQVTIVSTATLYRPTTKILQKATSHGQQPLQPTTPSMQSAVGNAISGPQGVEPTAQTITPNQFGAYPASSPDAIGQVPLSGAASGASTASGLPISALSFP